MINFSDIYSFARDAFRYGLTHCGKRDTWEVFGYEKGELGIKDYRARYERGDISGRIVDAYPDACWNNKPVCVEDEEDDEMTAWEQTIEDFFKSVSFWSNIHRLDLMAQLGCYSVLFIGYADTVDLTQPAPRGKLPLQLIPLSEDQATIHESEKDVTNPRLGQPLIYKIKVTGKAEPVMVHYSRILHVADGSLSNPLQGIPLLKKCWNRLDDLDKVVGSSAEIWWLNGRGGLSIEAEAGTELPTDTDALKASVEDYQNNFKRTMFLGGVTAKPLNHAIPDPQPNFKILIALISGTTCIPTRILLGSESGELASSQDETNWNSRVKERRGNYCEPSILNEFIDRLIEQGALAKPKNPYKWEWPELDQISKKDQAEIASKKSSALVAYANSPEADKVITPRQFVEDILNMQYREDDIDEIVLEEEKQAEEDRKLMEKQGIPPIPGAKPPTLPFAKKTA